MSRDTGNTTTSRRKFLRSLAVMGGAAAVVASADGNVAEPAAGAAPATGKPAGYRMTPHVAKYYDKARI
ncbi:MAG TPA: twin-arginine translocation signal domain-containing protein [Steroidobacteraceae bacterium]|nr:twin-arginine translocation signal domain-containing protein [Steroidobacteraceae bacterium]